ncbi:protein SLC31A2 [Drosophila montana]|uniref:protein SLC31A2 n=1 Tax=Drosophila montana TaxID=40370 RepID=UPI00313BD824
MDLRYNVGRVHTAFTRESRHHHQHDHHQGPGSPGSTEAGNAETVETRSGQGCGHGGHGGSMIFHCSDRETILFQFWTTDSTTSIVLSCLVVFIMAILYEALKCYREWLKKCGKKRQEGGDNRTPSRMQQFNTPISEPALALPMPELPVAPENPRAGPAAPWLSPMHWYQTLLHMIQVTISFLLMLIFMTFNVWLCIAVVLGAGVGYYIFFARSENVSDHCN